MSISGMADEWDPVVGGAFRKFARAGRNANANPPL
jgi:hypothetical protein